VKKTVRVIINGKDSGYEKNKKMYYVTLENRGSNLISILV
jgi:hypothetical protein